MLVFWKITMKYIAYSCPVAANDTLEGLISYLKHAEGFTVLETYSNVSSEGLSENSKLGMQK